MELFRLSTMGVPQGRTDVLYDDIMHEINVYPGQQLAKKVNFFIQSTEIYCVVIASKFKLKKDLIPLTRAISNGVAAYVIHEIERHMFSQFIRSAYPEYGQDDASRIEDYCIDVINNSSIEIEKDGKKIRKKKLAAAFEQYLANQKILNIYGFVQFRLASYKNDLRDVVEYAVEEFIMDLQYQEFILLLQYFVFVQDRKVPEVHIIHKEGSEFVILDDRYMPIDKKETEDFVVEMIDKDLNYEDMIISALISISPEKIWIHTRQRERQVIKTIQQIFENRTVICDDCYVCHPVLEKYTLDR